MGDGHLCEILKIGAKKCEIFTKREMGDDGGPGASSSSSANEYGIMHYNIDTHFFIFNLNMF